MAASPSTVEQVLAIGAAKGRAASRAAAASVCGGMAGTLASSRRRDAMAGPTLRKGFVPDTDATIVTRIAEVADAARDGRSH